MTLRPKTLSITTGAAPQLVADGQLVDPTTDVTIRADALAAALAAYSSAGMHEVADAVNREHLKKQLVLTAAAAVAARR